MVLVLNACQEDLGNAVLATEVTPNSNYKMEHFSYKGEWEMNNDALKKASLQFHNNKFGLK